MLISKASVSSAIRPDAPEKRPKPSTESVWAAHKSALKLALAKSIIPFKLPLILSVKITDAHSWICNDVLPAPPV